MPTMLLFVPYQFMLHESTQSRKYPNMLNLRTENTVDQTCRNDNSAHVVRASRSRVRTSALQPISNPFSIRYKCILPHKIHRIRTQ